MLREQIHKSFRIFSAKLQKYGFKESSVIEPLKRAKNSNSQVRRLSYPVSKHLWKMCENQEERKIGV